MSEVINLGKEHLHIGIICHFPAPVIQNLFDLESTKQILKRMIQKVLLVLRLLNGTLLLQRFDSLIDILNL